MKLSYLFSDGMVLQRGKKNYIWGETSPEIMVTGILDGKKFNTKADTHGMFVAELPDLPVGGPYCMEINGDEKRVIRNIMSGDVFLLGGQSNMELRIKFVTERFADEIKKINDTRNAIMIAENLIKNKGFQDLIIFINGDSISIIVKAKELKEEQIAQIQNIISRELKGEIENIHISNKE